MAELQRLVADQARAANESVSGLCEAGADGVTCIVMDADHRRIYHGGRPVPPYASTEALLRDPESQPESDLLDLVRQYGAKREQVIDMLNLADREELAKRFGGESDALLARIEVEVQRLRAAARSVSTNATAAALLTELRSATEVGWWEYDEHGRDRALRLIDQIARTQVAVQPDPLVLTLPQVPEGATLAGSSGHRYVLRGGVWDDEHGPWSGFLGAVLDRERPEGVTVEMAPPREPRTWPALDGDDLADLPTLVEVDGTRYRRSGDAAYIQERTGGIWGWWALRGRGDVREVFE